MGTGDSVAMIDMKGLMERAARSEEREAFQTMDRRPGLRIGAGARAPSTFFVEVLIDPFPEGLVDLDAMEKALGQLRWLEVRGYRLSCRDGRAVCGERVMPQEELVNEVAALQRFAGAARERL
jgi:hypothetical protein